MPRKKILPGIQPSPCAPGPKRDAEKQNIREYLVRRSFDDFVQKNETKPLRGGIRHDFNLFNPDFSFVQTDEAFQSLAKYVEKKYPGWSIDRRETTAQERIQFKLPKRSSKKKKYFFITAQYKAPILFQTFGGALTTATPKITTTSSSSSKRKPLGELSANTPLDPSTSSKRQKIHHHDGTPLSRKVSM